ncbi:acyl-CoA dehydrogenase family protein [Natronomonas halophila]|uniref:acyl-CoA dehydrogenase family protein n=1 Tax=Natronomonas halophila TaxID=2747817 RepID=UPI0015B67D54|nr:acyl-CoA dehydrogenase family protein [Natronomonas halophila]QLD84199.1 acyl-CoA dehydrogenase family protein [Natronomonas halophila]
MEYHDSEQATELAARAREFVDDVVIPTEREHLGDGPVGEDVIEELREEARERNVYCPQIDEAHGGMGMDLSDVLPLFEEAGRSLLGAAAMRVDAPDEGNMHTLELVGTEEQKEEWLEPLVEGEIRSAFGMTEPRDGAGSDPKMLKTTARKEGDEYVINGHKWWTTQGSHADVILLMAVTDQDVHPYKGASIILVPTDADGVEMVRDIPHLGPDLDGHGHAEFRFNDVRVPEENLLGQENTGFAIAQQRLGPARLTHCMRFSGMARRALTIAKAYMKEREAFGTDLAQKQSLRYDIADKETELHAARTMVRHAAEEIARGEQARVPVSMSKVFTANVCQEAIDLAIQCTGGSGISRDLPLADFYEGVRAFRIVDGADEVHQRVIARDAFDGAEEHTDELENLPTF